MNSSTPAHCFTRGESC